MMNPCRRSLWPGAGAVRSLGAAAGFGLATALVVAAWLEAGNEPFTANFREPADALMGLAVLAVAASGVAVHAGRPGHLTGRLAIAFGLLFGAGLLANAVAVRVLLAGQGPSALGSASAWLTTFVFVPTFALLCLLLPTWPDGFVATGWLRNAARVLPPVVLLTSTAQALSPGRIDGVGAGYEIRNPWGVERLDGLTAAVTAAGVLVLLLFGLAGAADLLWRTVRARGEQRQQLRPVAAAVLLLALSVMVSVLLLDENGWVFVGVLVALIGVALALTAAVRGTRRRERAERERAVVVQEREDERYRLRQALHDGVGPLLAALRLELDTISDEAATARARDLLAESMDEVRRISRGLRPAMLDELGLAAALRQRVTSLSATVAWEVELPPELDLPVAAEVAVFHIAGEAMTNVVRHSGAHRAVLQVVVRAGDVVVEVTDDGVTAPPTRLGVGLLSMRDRAEQLGGTLEMDALPTGGMRLRAVVPAVVT